VVYYGKNLLLPMTTLRCYIDVREGVLGGGRIDRSLDETSSG
jgi:hypothetical protein